MRLASLAFCAALAGACTSTGTGPIEVRSGALTVSGSAFTCAGSWPSSMTPCATPWQSNAAVGVSAAGPGMIELSLYRTPIPVDGGASVVTITLDLDHDGHVIGAYASEDTTRAGDVHVIESSEATGGWVQPSVVSADPTARQAGAFVVDFAWGSIQGTYDTAK